MMNLNRLCAGYGGVEILHGVSLRLCPGEVTAIIGPNGCGKSTLLKTAAGLLSAAGGEILLDNKKREEYSRKEWARHVALLPQSRPVPAISVQSLVLHGRFPYLGFPRNPSGADRRAVEQAMGTAGVLPWRHRNLTELSGGERQRVYLAMLLAQDADYLFLDEPTTFLDIGRQLEILQLSCSLARQGKAVVMVLHDLGQALSCAGRVCLMEGGAVVSCGTPEEVFQSGEIDRVFQVRTERIRDGRGEFHYLFAPEA